MMFENVMDKALTQISQQTFTAIFNDEEVWQEITIDGMPYDLQFDPILIDGKGHVEIYGYPVIGGETQANMDFFIDAATEEIKKYFYSGKEGQAAVVDSHRSQRALNTMSGLKCK